MYGINIRMLYDIASTSVLDNNYSNTQFFSLYNIVYRHSLFLKQPITVTRYDGVFYHFYYVLL